MIEQKAADDAIGNGRNARQNPVVGNNAYIKDFYRCLLLLNSQETHINDERVSVAKDYFQNAAEICYLGKSIKYTLEFSTYCDFWYL